MEQQNVDIQNTSGPKSVKNPKKDDGKGSLIWGVILITLGVIFLLERYTNIHFRDLWPIVLIVAGLLLLRNSYIKPKE